MCAAVLAAGSPWAQHPAVGEQGPSPCPMGTGTAPRARRGMNMLTRGLVGLVQTSELVHHQVSECSLCVFWGKNILFGRHLKAAYLLQRKPAAVTKTKNREHQGEAR